MDITMQFPSGKDFDRLLSEMEQKVGIKVLRDATRGGRRWPWLKLI